MERFRTLSFKNKILFLTIAVILLLSFSILVATRFILIPALTDELKRRGIAIAQSLADLIAAGGYGAIGAHGQRNGPGSHWEVWMAASALGPMGALEVASLHGARFIGREQDLGSLETGKLADFMVLNSNPLVDIKNTLDIQYVTKGGVVYQGDTLDEIWPRVRKYGNYFWVNPDALRSDERPLR